MSEDADYREEKRSYFIGFGLAAVLSATAFGLVAWGGLSRTTSLWFVGVTALLQILVHFRFFLHIDLSKSKRDDLQLILFTFLIIALMAGGTLWILSDLRMRMM